MKQVKQKAINIRKKIFKNKLQMLLLVLMFALTLNLVCVSYIMYVKKHRKPFMIYETTAAFLTINNRSEEVKTPGTEEEEKPIVIKKGKINDKEDGEKLYTDSSLANAKAYSIYDALALYESPGKSLGIDVSKYQGNINWKAVADSGVEFAIIRCGYRGYGSGEILMDPYFEKNIKGALDNGIKVGVYFFSAAINESEAIEEARFTEEVIKNYPITYPVAYDFEIFNKGRCGYLSKSVMTTNALAFLNHIKSKGYTPMMYASRNAFYERWETSRLSGFKTWLAHYTTQTNYTGSYQMWQYTSAGSVPGISGNVDMDIAYFRYTKEPPAKEPVVEEKKEEPDTPNTEEKNVLTFNNQNDYVVTTTEAEFFLDYNQAKSGIISKGTKLERIAISTDGVWSKVKYEDKEIYLKSANLEIYQEEKSN